MHVMKMCQAMVQEGHEITLYAPRRTGRYQVVDEDLWHHYGIGTRFPMRWLLSTPGLKGYDYAWRAVRAAKAEGVELVHTRYIPAALLAVLFGMKSTCEIHTPPSGLLGPTLFGRFLRSGPRRRVVVITEALQRWLASWWLPARNTNTNIDVVVAHDGIDLERFADLPDAAGARRALGCRDEFTVVYSGHLYPGRGVELLLNLAEALPGVEFLFVGGEPTAVAARRSEVEARRLSNAKFIGFVPNAVLPRYLAAGDVLVMPHQGRVSASGGGDIAAFMSPLKMFEYLAADRLIMSSDLPVLREVLNDDIAVLCQPDNLVQWRDGILRAKGNPAWRLQMAAEGRRLVVRYTWRERVRRCLDGLAGAPIGLTTNQPKH